MWRGRNRWYGFFTPHGFAGANRTALIAAALKDRREVYEYLLERGESWLLHFKESSLEDSSIFVSTSFIRYFTGATESLVVEENDSPALRYSLCCNYFERNKIIQAKLEREEKENGPESRERMEEVFRALQETCNVD